MLTVYCACRTPEGAHGFKQMTPEEFSELLFRLHSVNLFILDARIPRSLTILSAGTHRVFLASPYPPSPDFGLGQVLTIASYVRVPMDHPFRPLREGQRDIMRIRVGVCGVLYISAGLQPSDIRKLNVSLFSEHVAGGSMSRRTVLPQETGRNTSKCHLVHTHLQTGIGLNDNEGHLPRRK